MGTKGVPIARPGEDSRWQKERKNLTRTKKERMAYTRSMEHHRRESQAKFAKSLDKFFKER